MKNSETVRNRGKLFHDVPRLRELLYQLGREHARLRTPLARMAAAGSVLSGKGECKEARREAREAWRDVLEVVEWHMAGREEQQLLECAERLGLVSEELAGAMIKVCDRLNELEANISNTDFDNGPPASVSAAGDAMQNFAAMLDDLALHEDREVLPRLQRLLYQQGAESRR